MGCAQNWFCRHGNSYLILSLLLLISSSYQVKYMAEGRSMAMLKEAAQKGMEEKKMAVMVMAQIGSTPPRCDGRCSNCGHCEAVQVPVTAHAQSHWTSYFIVDVRATPTIAYSRGDDISNYKPMSWKCKCGNLIFNP